MHKACEKMPLGEKCGQGDNIKKGLEEISCDVSWIQLSHDRVQQW
jgi:hypothetical protein